LIAIDSSALVAVAMCEPEEEAFSTLIGSTECLVGTPTLVETRMVLQAMMLDSADRFIEEFVSETTVHPVLFSMEMYYAAIEAFRRFGKGQGHPAQLNFGDCLAYAVAKHNDVPLLYKGRDFGRTDIRTAAGL
jgi:ribonuclease VapC